MWGLRTLSLAPGSRRAVVASAVFAAVVALAAIWIGMLLHRWTWDQTDPIRFRFDIENAWTQGSRALREGYLGIYDRVAREATTDAEGRPQYSLDYAPGRLLVATLWVRWARTHFPDADRWQDTWDFNAPLLTLNRVALLASAAGAFSLTRHWLKREHRQSGQPHPHAAIWLPTLAALVLWFNPAAIIAGFGWPQWDIWLTPFFIWALVAGSSGRWIIAGALLGAGAMFKGQLLAFCPVLILWPLFGGRPLAVVRLAAGFAIAWAACSSPWLLRTTDTGAVNWSAAFWVICCTTAAVLASVRKTTLLRGRWPVALCLSAAAMALAVIPAWSKADDAIKLAQIAGLALAIGIFGWFVRPRWIPAMAITGMAVSMLLVMPLYGASDNWFRIGFGFGVRHFRHMTMGPMSNLASILDTAFNVHDPESVATTIGPAAIFGSPADVIVISWRQLLFGIYAVLTVLSCIAMAVHDRRNNRRFLVAAVAPLIFFVAFPTQIHERYPLYAAVCSAIIVVCGVGPTLLHALVSALAFLTILHAMLLAGSPAGEFANDANTLLRTLSQTHPGLGYLLILLALVYLWSAMSGGTVNRRTDSSPVAGATRSLHSGASAADRQLAPAAETRPQPLHTSAPSPAAPHPCCNNPGSSARPPGPAAGTPQDS
jgi:hypothetical protein